MTSTSRWQQGIKRPQGSGFGVYGTARSLGTLWRTSWFEYRRKVVAGIYSVLESCYFMVGSCWLFYPWFGMFLFHHSAHVLRHCCACTSLIIYSSPCSKPFFMFEGHRCACTSLIAWPSPCSNDCFIVSFRVHSLATTVLIVCKQPP